MKKENQTPNVVNREKKYSNKTPDSMSSRGGFKPKFIVKNTQPEIHINHDLVKSHNEVILDEILSSNSPLYQSKESLNYKSMYHNVKEELDERTENFNDVIELCTGIVYDIHKTSRINRMVSPEDMEEKLKYIHKKTRSLLETFHAFQRNN